MSLLFLKTNKLKCPKEPLMFLTSVRNNALIAATPSAPDIDLSDADDVTSVLSGIDNFHSGKKASISAAMSL